MMKVCHITPLHKSNDVRIFYKECCSLVKEGFEVYLLVVNEESRTECGVNIIGKTVPFKNRLERFRKASKILHNEALRINADIYHFHDPEFLPFAYKMARMGKKMVYDVHEDVPRQILSKYWLPKPLRKLISFAFERFENKVVKKMAAVVCATDKISERFALLNKKVSAIKNYPILREWIDELNVTPESNSICYVGGITKVRGIVELVNALEGTDIQLHLAGEFSPAGLKDEVSALPGWKNVVYHGLQNRNGVKQIMGRCKIGMVTLHPIINYVDALPVKMFEYMAAGLAIVASDIMLWKQIVTDAQCGVVVDPMNPLKIREAVQSLLHSSSRVYEMGQKGKMFVRDVYNWENEAAKMKHIYGEIINE